LLVRAVSKLVHWSESMHRRFSLVATAVVLAAAAALPARSHGPNDPPHQMYQIGDLKLESGEIIKDFAISYVTHGTLNER